MSGQAPPPSAIRAVPVGATMREAYLAVFSSLPLLLRAAALPFALSLVILSLAFMAGENAFLSFVLMVVGFVPYTLFGVAWHRLSLLGPARGAPATFPSWRARHWRFLGYVMGATALGIVLGWSLASLTGGAQSPMEQRLGPLLSILAGWVMFVCLIYVLLRFSFVFPATAVDERYTLANSWAHTRGQVLRLLATLIVTALPMLVLIWAVSALLGRLLLPEMGPPGGSAEITPQAALQEAISENAAAFILAQIVLAVLNYVLMALMVSAISIAFREATGWVPATPAMPAVRDADENGRDDDEDRGGGGA